MAPAPEELTHPPNPDVNINFLENNRNKSEGLLLFSDMLLKD